MGYSGHYIAWSKTLTIFLILINWIFRETTDESTRCRSFHPMACIWCFNNWLCEG